MKLLIVLALVACAAAAPAEDVVVTVSEKFEKAPNGEYTRSYELSNGVKQEEEGSLRTVNDEENKPHEVIVTRGYYLLPKPDGTFELLEYVADQNGFQPKSAALPVGPVS